MEAKDLLIKNRYCANHFNKGDYPSLFERIKDEISALLDGPDSDSGDRIEGIVSEVLDEVQANMDRYRFNFRKKSVFVDDHLVLSLFVVPAAAKIGSPAAQKFCELLPKRFVERFPGTTFKVGDYDAIMEGFKWKIKLPF